MGLLAKIVGVLLISVCATALVYEHLEYREGQRYILFPDGNGKLHLVDLEKTEIAPKFDAKESVKFYLYRRDDSRREIIFQDDDALKALNFDTEKPVKIIVHGWNSDFKSPVNSLITEAFLRIYDVNVIVVDWSKGASFYYPTAVKNVITVAVHLGGLIDWLVGQGVPMNNFHLMGHSLGGHLVGIAGRHINRGKLPYVTAMDPAGPLWGSGTPRINPSDAQYVEIIHTDGGNLGLSDPLGHNDFYPNKGKSQPGCFLSLSCDHSRSYEFMADSIDHIGFMAVQCTDYKEMTNGKCAGPATLHMGGSFPKPALGIFHLSTNSKKPFFQSPVG